MVGSLEDVAALTVRLFESVPGELRDELRPSIVLEARKPSGERAELMERRPLGPSWSAYVEVGEAWRIEGVSLGLFRLSPGVGGGLGGQLDLAVKAWAPLIGSEWIPVAVWDGDAVCLSSSRPGVFLVDHARGTGQLLGESFEDVVVMAGAIVAARLDGESIRLDGSRFAALGASERDLWAELAAAGGVGVHVGD